MDMDFRDKFKEEKKYVCYDDTFCDIIQKAYGKHIEIQAEELELYGSSIQRTAYSKWQADYEHDEFKEFMKSGEYPGTCTLLTALCIDGYIEQGDYLICCGS